MEHDKYITAGIQNEIPLPLIHLMWSMIEAIPPEIERDYLQVFEITGEVDASTGKVVKQAIRHFQEVPPYESHATCQSVGIRHRKVYVIDDGPYSVMCFPEER